MNEYTIGWLASCAGLGVVLASTLYWIGGRSNKWIRRFVSPAVICGTICGVSLGMGNFHWAMLAVCPLLSIGYHLGYGGDDVKTKIVKRLYYALACSGSGVLLAIVLGGNAYWILPIQIAVALGTVYLGVKNPVYAAAEEFFVSVLLTVGLVMYPFVAA